MQQHNLLLYFAFFFKDQLWAENSGVVGSGLSLAWPSTVNYHPCLDLATWAFTIIWAGRLTKIPDPLRLTCLVVVTIINSSIVLSHSFFLTLFYLLEKKENGSIMDACPGEGALFAFHETVSP